MMLIDKPLRKIIAGENSRQKMQLSLIASENIMSESVMAAFQSGFANKTIEGYHGHRYHAGAQFVDQLEQLTQERACRLFAAKIANVQPHSCSQANQAVFLSALQPGDIILSMSPSSGGHISHGLKSSFAGRFFRISHYTVDRDTELIDYDAVKNLAEQHQPKLIIAGGSSYSRAIDYARFSSIAQSVGAWLLSDMSQIAGLVAGHAIASPIPHSDFVTSSTYKTLRGPRGGFILLRDYDLAKKIDLAIFPGLQGTPCLNIMAAKAACLGEALDPIFAHYAENLVTNAQIFAKTCMEQGIKVVSNGTDTHIVLLDLRSLGISGQQAAQSLERAGLLCNMNIIPFDARPPTQCSGIRLGLSVATSLGLECHHITEIATWIIDILTSLAAHHKTHGRLEAAINDKVLSLMRDVAWREETPMLDVYPSRACIPSDHWRKSMN